MLSTFQSYKQRLGSRSYFLYGLLVDKAFEFVGVKVIGGQGKVLVISKHACIFEFWVKTRPMDDDTSQVLLTQVFD